MPSDRKIAANRSNAQKSTGPRTKGGREASRRNAQRHGLAIKTGEISAFSDDIEKLSKLLSLASGTKKVSEHAREAAEAELDLSRIRKVRAWLYDNLFFADTANPNGLTDLNDKLAKLERYERRAFSRRNRALRSLYQAPRFQMPTMPIP
jgi:hypothetical protein